MTAELTCRQAFDRLDDYLDRELDPGEAASVTAHLEICENCAREFRFEARLLEGLKSKLARISVPGGLAGRISAALARAGSGNSG